VVLDGLPVGSGALRVRVGSDAALYVATTAIRRQDAEDLGSYSGKILRFTPAGTTPADNPLRLSPVVSLGLGGRLDFDWEPATGALWNVETDHAGVSLGRPNAGQEARAVARLDGIRPGAASFHSGATPAAWRGSLFLASADEQCLYRVSGFESSPLKPAVERLFAGSYGRIVAVLSSDDGLYFATENGGNDASGQPADSVYRVRDKALRMNSPARRER
jgi:glucose/arabinose dehydrogenase